MSNDDSLQETGETLPTKVLLTEFRSLVVNSNSKKVTIETKNYGQA